MDTPALLSLIGSLSSALATVILVFLTGRYVRLTHALVQEAKLAKYPNVFVDVEFDEIDVKFIVGNSGSTPALDVTFNVKDSVPWRKLKDFPSGLASISAVQKGIAYLAPGRTLKFQAGYVDYDPKFFADGSTIDIALSFKTESGQTLNRQFTIELRSYAGILLESFRDPEREVAKAIRDAEFHRRSDQSMSTSIRGMFKKSCPSCGEQVSRAARKCPHCHDPIPAEPPQPDA